MGIRKSLFHSALGRYGDIALSFLGVIVTTRLLTPREIGIFTISFSVVMIAETLRNFGIGNYLVQENELTTTRVRTAGGVALLFGCGVAVCLVAASGLIADFYNEPAMQHVIWILALNFILVPIGSPSMALLRREMRFDLLAIVQIAASSSRLIVSVALVLLGASFFSMAWAAVAASFVSILALVLMRAPHVTTTPSLQEWRRVFKVGSAYTITSILNQVGALLPDLILGRTLSLDAVAYYSRANRVIAIFTNGVVGAVDGVLQPSFASANRTSPASLKPSLLGATTILTGVSWPFLTFTAIFAAPTVRFLFGPQWGQSGPVLTIICLAMALYFFMFNSRSLIIGLGLVKQMFQIELVVQTIWLGLLLFGAQHGLQTVAWCYVGAQAVFVLAHILMLRTQLQLTLRELFRSVRESLLVTLACGMVALMCNHIFAFDGLSLFWQLPLAGLIFSAAWLCSVFLFRHKLAAELLHLTAVAKKKLFAGRSA